MSRSFRNATLLVAGLLALPTASFAAVYPVFFDDIDDSIVLSQPLVPGDSIQLDTLIDSPQDALSQSITFFLSEEVGQIRGVVTWNAFQDFGNGVDLPEFNGVDVKVIGPNGFLLDPFATIPGDLGYMQLFSGVGASGEYRIEIATWGEGHGSLDLALAAVPEPETYLQMLAGLGVAGWLIRKKRLLK